MKKIIVYGIILVLVLAVWAPISALAADGPDFTVASNVSAERGGTVTVPISVAPNPGFSAVGLVVSYNANALEITGVTGNVSAMPLSSQFALTTAPGTQWISLINPNSENWQGTGVVAEVTFNVKSTAPLGTSSIGLSFTSSPDGTPADAEGNILRDAFTYSGSVHIYEAGSGNQPLPPTIPTPPTPANPDPGPGGSGGFIGTPDVPLNDPPTPTPTPAPVPQPPPVQDAGSGSDDSEDFGEVPQTGISDTWLVITLAILFSISVFLWVRVIRRQYQ